jgi:energy-coupling factor transporter ATP-binding protein EcfA2
MLEKLQLKQFTVFADACFEFGPGLNVIVGENGLGKTHVLKAAYAMLDVLARGKRDSGAGEPSTKFLEGALAKKLRNVFRPDSLGRLSRRQRGVNRSEMTWQFSGAARSCRAHFTTKSNEVVSIDAAPRAWMEKLPVYLPARELMSIYPGFVSLYETTHLEFDETWRDACVLLGAALAKGPREATIKKLLAPLEQAMGGSVELDPSGRFYLKTPTGRVEMHLVAEGLRKLAAVARLIATGSLLDKGALFWDEPESNLHPCLVKEVAATVLRVVDSGVQTFIATHSLFLLRELEILSQKRPKPAVRYFSLRRGPEGVIVGQGDSIEDVGDLSLLDENLAQSQRYVAAGVAQ